MLIFVGAVREPPALWPSGFISRPPGGGGVVRFVRRAAHHQPRTPIPCVPCCSAYPRNRSPATLVEVGSRRIDVKNIINILRFSQRATGGVGGFSALFRSAPLHQACLPVGRADVYVTATGVIRGKTGPAPSGLPAPSRARQAGALLFRPFSWAMQEKGQGNRGRLGVAKILTHGWRAAVASTSSTQAAQAV